MVAFLGVYAALWAATAIWGPADVVACQRAYEDDYYGSMRMDPENYRTHLSGFVVPAPFVVMAEFVFVRHSIRKYS